MKMEVLSVQNHIQGQFGVIGSSKVKDWTSSLTPPPLPPQQQQQNQKQQLKNLQLQHLQQQTEEEQQHKLHLQPLPEKRSHDISLASGCGEGEGNAITDTDAGGDCDVVDGRPSTNHDNFHHYHHQHPQYQQQQQYNHYHLYSASDDTGTGMRTAAATATAVSVPVESSTVSGANVAVGSRYAYNNNLLCCEPAQAVDDAATPPDELGGYFGTSNGAGDDMDTAAVAQLSQRLQAVLRAAKSQHLACTEVSLPWDLTSRIAAEIIRSSEREPCGVRGCTIFVEFEDEPKNTRRIASLKVDPYTVSTFELYLTLKQDRSGWTSLLPQFLKNLTRSSTILISPDFTLTKNKLYAFE